MSIIKILTLTSHHRFVSINICEQRTSTIDKTIQIPERSEMKFLLSMLQKIKSDVRIIYIYIYILPDGKHKG